jgi:hypothetical protein
MSIVAIVVGCHYVIIRIPAGGKERLVPSRKGSGGELYRLRGKGTAESGIVP